MKIGVIGNGFIGRSMAQLKCKDIEVFAYDIIPDLCQPKNIQLIDLNKCEIIFISVPTPMRNDGICHLSILESVLYDLHSIEYTGFIVLRAASVSLGTSNKLNCYFISECLTKQNHTQYFMNNKNWIFGLLNLNKKKDEEFELTIRNLFQYALNNNTINHNNLHFVPNTEAELIQLFRKGASNKDTTNQHPLP